MLYYRLYFCFNALPTSTLRNKHCLVPSLQLRENNDELGVFRFLGCGTGNNEVSLLACECNYSGKVSLVLKMLFFMFDPLAS